MIIQVYTRTFPSSPSPPLYVNPSYFHPYFSLQTAQQFTETLDRMLSMPGTSLITSQGTPRPPGPRCCLGYGRCLLQFICQVCMKRKRYLGFQCRESIAFKKKCIFIFLYKRIQDYFATLMIISIALSSTASNSSMSSSSFSLS